MNIHRITFMMMKTIQFRVTTLLLILVSAAAFLACKQEIRQPETRVPEVQPGRGESAIDYDTTLWTEIKAEDGFVIDVKYATADNFVKEVIYPCGRMFLRPAVAARLFGIRDEIFPKGYRLKLFDGYRPRPAQQKLWDKVPNPNYVAPPSEGSMHNRGVAIDLTITDLNGAEIDMGTPYDFFGPEAHHDFTNLPAAVLEHRQFLKSVMESNGFQSIRTEWWHYSYTRGSYPLDDWQWPCQN